ncbi:MAG: hypothetical protein WC568_01505 [Candidatus Methanoperedens sp.]
MTPDIAAIIVITAILVFIFEYIKFFNETRSVSISLFLHKQLLFPLCVYLFILMFISILAIFSLRYFTSFDDYEFPINIMLISFMSSIFSTGIINNIEFFISDKEMNKLRKIINDYRRNIVSVFKKIETVEMRKIGSKLEKSKTLFELKNEYKMINPDKFPELEEKYKNRSEDEQKSNFAFEIVTENLDLAKSLIQ